MAEFRQSGKFIIGLLALIIFATAASCIKHQKESAKIEMSVRLTTNKATQTFEYYYADSLVLSCFEERPVFYKYLQKIESVERAFRREHFSKDFFKDCPYAQICHFIYWTDYLRLTNTDTLFNVFVDLNCFNDFLQQAAIKKAKVEKKDIAKILSKILFAYLPDVLTKEDMDSLSLLYKKRFEFQQIQKNNKLDCNWQKCGLVRNIQILNNIRDDFNKENVFYLYKSYRGIGYVGPPEEFSWLEPFLACQLYEKAGILQVRVKLLNPWALAP